MGETNQLYPARHYEAAEEGAVRCLLCPRRCVIKPGKAGVCRVRLNVEGRLFTANYAQVTSYAMDPMEKKPLYHFYPGSYIFSLGTLGCNLHCQFCQNWTIAHGNPPALEIAPEEAVAVARQEAERCFCVGIAYTYSEPVVWYEYVMETARLAREAGLKNVLVTNGFISEAPLRELLPLVDAMNIDVKAFTSRFYRQWCKGELEPVIRTVEIACRECHVELTNLLIPGLNDGEDEVKELVNWVAGLSPDIPLHFSRYFPRYKMNLPPTPLATLERAYRLARERLNYVYLGNVADDRGSSTCCPRCGELLIKRWGYEIEIAGLKGDRCGNCGNKIPVVVKKGEEY